jgi:hypothetical protein
LRQQPWASMQASVERRLELGGITLHSGWTFDVPEYLPNPEEVYVMLSWGRAPEDVPAFEAVRDLLHAIFDRYASSDGLIVRHRRYLWKAIVEDAARKTQSAKRKLLGG